MIASSLLIGFSRPIMNVTKNSMRSLGYLGRLEPSEGSVKGYKRLGRGASSDKGKTSGRGQKGQKARGKVPFLFEGGQTPLYKRLPFYGFSNAYNAMDYHKVRLDKIQDYWNNGKIPLKEGETLTIKVMRDCGLITGSIKDGVKLYALKGSTFNVPLNIEASKATIPAIEQIEAANVTFTARYFTNLGLRAHLDPEKFLLRKGYVPLPARPTSQKDIQYYSDPEKRGYLAKDESILAEPLRIAREEYDNRKAKKVVSKFKSLEEQLQDASSTAFRATNRTVSVNDLN